MSQDTETNQTESERNESDPVAGQQPSTGPDIDLVDANEWPERSFPADDARRENSVRVVVRQSVLNAIHRHGQTRTDVEICGVMIGNGYRDERGPFVYIEQIIEGQHSDGQTAQVTFTGETWNHIHGELDQKYPELRILGWYHTHPGFGIFLSAMDLFIHENYFSADEQLAFVYDPLGGDEGLFVWRSGKATRDGLLIEPDVPEDPPIEATPPSEMRPVSTDALSVTARTVESGTPQIEPSMGHDEETAARVARLERRLSFLSVFVALLIFYSLAVTLLMAPLLIEHFGARVPGWGGERQHRAPNRVLVNPPRIAPDQEKETSDPEPSGKAEVQPSANESARPKATGEFPGKGTEPVESKTPDKPKSNDGESKEEKKSESEVDENDDPGEASSSPDE